MPGCLVAAEPDQHRLGHVERHDAEGGGEGDQAGAGREGDAEREAGVRVAAGAHLVGEQHPVEPAVDDSVAGPQHDRAPVLHERRERPLGLDVDRLGVGGGVAEGLQDQVGAEPQAGQVLELASVHRAGGVLAADGGDGRLAVGAGAHAVDAAGPADDLLGQRVAGTGGRRESGRPERRARSEAEGPPGLVGQVSGR